eukprot:GEMP01027463.1.p1 GENE.GEMP01027463.1~~GEMP01027463.1.p1  ORF type:complete len:263 (+),score=70.71 GEMP01027463.1:251-1039(+)
MHSPTSASSSALVPIASGSTAANSASMNDARAQKINLPNIVRKIVHSTRALHSMRGGALGSKAGQRDGFAAKPPALSLQLTLCIPAWGVKDRLLKVLLTEHERIPRVLQKVKNFGPDLRAWDSEYVHVYDKGWRAQSLDNLERELEERHQERTKAHADACAHLQHLRREIRLIEDPAALKVSPAEKGRVSLLQSRERVRRLEMQLKVLRQSEKKVDRSTQTDLVDYLPSIVPEYSDPKQTVSLAGLRDRMSSLLDGVLSIGK